MSSKIQSVIKILNDKANYEVIENTYGQDNIKVSEWIIRDDIVAKKIDALYTQPAKTCTGCESFQEDFHASQYRCQILGRELNSIRRPDDCPKQPAKTSESETCRCGHSKKEHTSDDWCFHSGCDCKCYEPAKSIRQAQDKSPEKRPECGGLGLIGVAGCTNVHNEKYPVCDGSGIKPASEGLLLTRQACLDASSQKEQIKFLGEEGVDWWFEQTSFILKAQISKVLAHCEPLIRQQYEEEINKLKEDKITAFDNGYTEGFGQAQAEIERLKKELDDSGCPYCDQATRADERKKTLKLIKKSLGLSPDQKVIFDELLAQLKSGGFPQFLA